MEKLFSLWPTVADFARDIGALPVTARHWPSRGSIPARYDCAIVAAVKKRGGDVTYEDLAVWRAERKLGSAR